MLANVPEQERAEVIRQAAYTAHCADKYRKRLRTSHAIYGNGSFVSALGGWAPLAETPVNPHAYRMSMLQILQHLTQTDQR